MRIDQAKTFEELREYLCNFRNFGDPMGEYDFVGTFHLFDALLENLARHQIGADLESLAESYRLSFEQSGFLKKCLVHLSPQDRK